MPVMDPIEKQPKEIVFVEYSFEEYTTARNDTLVSLTVSTDPVPINTFAATVTMVGQAARLRVAGGQDKEKYAVSIVGETAGGQKIEVDVAVRLRELKGR